MAVVSVNKVIEKGVLLANLCPLCTSYPTKPWVWELSFYQSALSEKLLVQFR
jgi:hypothetical protein